MIDPAALLILLQEAAPELTWIPRVGAHTDYHPQGARVFVGLSPYIVHERQQLSLWTEHANTHDASLVPADPTEIARALYLQHPDAYGDSAAMQRFRARMKAQNIAAICAHKLEILETQHREAVALAAELSTEVEECKRALDAANATVRELLLSARGST